MIVTADEVKSSFRGTLGLLNSRSEGLKEFDMSERGFWRSFLAIWLTLPAYVIALAFERLRLGQLQPDRLLFENIGLDLIVALGHVASFIALPLVMIWIAPRLGLARACVPFVIVTNWISVTGMLVLSVPAMLLLIGWATPGLTILFSVAFAVIVARLQWFATKETLGLPGIAAFGIVILGILLNVLIGGAVQALAG